MVQLFLSLDLTTDAVLFRAAKNSFWTLAERVMDSMGGQPTDEFHARRAVVSFARDGNLHLVKTLLALAPNLRVLNSYDDLGDWPSIPAAILSGNLDLVKLLVQEFIGKGRSIENPFLNRERARNTKTKGRPYPLDAYHAALKGGRTDIIRYVLQCNDIAKSIGSRCVCWELKVLAKMGHLAAVQMLVEEFNIEVDIPRHVLRPGYRASSPLSKAIQRDKRDVAEYLLKKGAKLRKRYLLQHVLDWGTDALDFFLDHITNWTAHSRPLLIQASINAQNEAFFHLLSRAAKTSEEQSRFFDIFSIHTAACGGSTEILSFLLKVVPGGLDESPTGTSSPLAEACAAGHEDAAIFLVENGANLDICDGYGRSPLLIAVVKCSAKLVGCLLAHGADPCALVRGRTLLQIACKENVNSAGIIRVLLDSHKVHPQSLDNTDDTGETLLHFVAEKGMTDELTSLSEAGANVNSISR